MIKPPVYNRLYDSCCWHPEDHQCGDGIKPGEPKDSGEDVPLCDVYVGFTASAEGGDHPCRDQANTGDEEGVGIGRSIEPFHGCTVTEQDAGDSERSGDVPQGTSEVEHPWVDQFDAGQAAHEPEAGGHGSQGRPAQSDGLEMGHPHPAKGPDGASREEIGTVELEGS
ncbi:MAG: hypothetical protein KatS3mg087_2036 [Patescibacteria group bacterium]|nr:MAG: hypothetical protein KatS3mg087_2036 [Patescibacteria group bacterium]